MSNIPSAMAEVITRCSLHSQQRSRKGTYDCGSSCCHSVVVSSDLASDSAMDTYDASSGKGGSGATVKFTLSKLVCLNMVVCGIEFCASAGFTYIPPMLLKAGFTEAAMTSVFGIGPFLALVTVPFLGRWSDRCQSPMGHRQPFIIGISVFLMVSLILIPYGQRIGNFLAPGIFSSVTLLVVGVILLDFSCHAGFNPCEALLADIMKHSDNQERGFMVYSSMVSLGGCIGYLITAVDWSSSSFASALGGQEQTAFSFVLFLYTLALLTTIVASRDGLYQVPNSQNVSYDYASLAPASHSQYSLLYKDKGHERTYDDIGYETGSNDSQEECFGTPTRTSTPTLEEHSSSNTPLIFQSVRSPLRDKWTAIGSLQMCLEMKLKAITQLPRTLVLQVLHRIQRLFDVPLVLQRLFVADFCSWTALMCHNMFYTDYVGQAVYGGNPNADDGSMERHLYDAGVRMGSWGLLVHSITSIFYVNLIQNTIIEMYGIKKTYFLGLAIFTVCMMGTLLSNNLALINIFAALSGTGFAAITTVPNMLVTAYHTDKEVYFSDFDNRNHINKKGDLLVGQHSGQTLDNGDKAESRGMAADIAVIDSAYFLSQTILSVFAGTIVDLTHSVSTYMIISIVFGLLACIFSTKVIFTANCMLTARRSSLKPCAL